MDLKIRLDEAKKVLEWDDVINLIDEVKKYIVAQEKEIADLRQRNDALVLLLEIERRSKNENK